jgi:hypothetical protein
MQLALKSSKIDQVKKKVSINVHEDIENKVAFKSILSVGDSLAKKEGSDTLFLYQSGKVSIFRMR